MPPKIYELSFLEKLVYRFLGIPSEHLKPEERQELAKIMNSETVNLANELIAAGRFPSVKVPMLLDRVPHGYQYRAHREIFALNRAGLTDQEVKDVLELKMKVLSYSQLQRDVYIITDHKIDLAQGTYEHINHGENKEHSKWEKESLSFAEKAEKRAKTSKTGRGLGG